MSLDDIFAEVKEYPVPEGCELEALETMELVQRAAPVFYALGMLCAEFDADFICMLVGRKGGSSLNTSMNIAPRPEAGQDVYRILVDGWRAVPAPIAEALDVLRGAVPAPPERKDEDHETR